jgi:hypothetical protein
MNRVVVYAMCRNPKKIIKIMGGRRHSTIR